MDETIKMNGEWSAYTLAPDVQEGDKAIGMLRDIERGNVSQSEARRFMELLKAQKIVLNVVHQHNIVPTVGRTRLARALTTGSATAQVNYIAIGTGTTAFTNASTQLNAETFRKVISDASYDNNIAYVDCFIASGDVANATYKEAAAFIDGTASANTGTALSLVVQDLTKSGSMYLSLKVTFT